MWHIGIDLHRKTVVMFAVHDSGEVTPLARFDCLDTEGIVAWFSKLRPLRAVIEATGTYRWLYELLAPLGTILLAHPLRLRAMVQRRSKTDRLDAQLLAHLLRLDQIPLAHIPSADCQMLRDLVRHRIRMTRELASAKISMRWILARHNITPPLKNSFGPRGRYWLSRQDLGPVDNAARDEILGRLAHFSQQIDQCDARLVQLQSEFPQVEALTVLYGVGLFTAMTVVAELGDITRFRRAKQVAAYAGLTAKTHQSGGRSYSGHISKQGSPWLRWVLVEAAMKLVRVDPALANFYRRIAKRSSAKIARVAAARKLAEICWKRLIRWQAERVQAVVPSS